MRNGVVKTRCVVVQAGTETSTLTVSRFVWLGGADGEFMYTVMELRSFIQPETYIKTCQFL
jgi:hypothetical protein